MAHELRRRGAFDGVPAPHQVLSLGLAMELPDARVETNIARVQQAESYRAAVVNEIGAQLGFSDGKNSGLLRLVADAAGALAPGGVLIVADYGDPKAEATPNSVSFKDLQAQAARSGLTGRIVPLSEALCLDVNSQALSTTRASLPALQALFASHGLASRGARGCAARSRSWSRESWISRASTACSGRPFRSARWVYPRSSSGRWSPPSPNARFIDAPKGRSSAARGPADTFPASRTRAS